MNIIKRYNTKIFFIVTLLFLISITTSFIVHADDQNETDTTNTTHNGQGLQGQGDNSNRGIMQGYTIWIIIIIIIIAVVIISYILITRNMKKQIEKNTKLMKEMLSTQTVTQPNPINPPTNDEHTSTEKTYQKIILKVLNYNENLVMKKLLEHHGTVNQSEISRIPSMGKVKASRVIRDMKQKEIIQVEPHGKINVIHLSDDLKSLFLHENK